MYRMPGPPNPNMADGMQMLAMPQAPHPQLLHTCPMGQDLLGKLGLGLGFHLVGGWQPSKLAGPHAMLPHPHASHPQLLSIQTTAASQALPKHSNPAHKGGIRRSARMHGFYGPMQAAGGV